MTSREWLETFLTAQGAVAGTVHRLSGNALVLEASVNIPEVVQKATASIPRGKGMAGLAWERQAPVSTCNLKKDETGDVRPGAKAVDANAAVALPVYDKDGRVRAVVGIAYADTRDLPEHVLATLVREASRLP